MLGARKTRNNIVYFLCHDKQTLDENQYIADYVVNPSTNINYCQPLLW